MNIIFKSNIDAIDQKYIVLDLDTFKLPDGSIHTACCVVENIPIEELPDAGKLKTLHGDLIANYGEKNWSFCEQSLEELMGKWGGELDSFYTELKKRIGILKTMTLNDNWSPIIPKN
jgi:hypothetical protein